MSATDKILQEHASDVARTVSCNMTAKEIKDLRTRFLERIELMRAHDTKLADFFERTLGTKHE